MSYKDLEAEIKAWAQLEKYAQQQKEEKQEQRRQAKRDKRDKKNRKTTLLPRLPAPAIERPFKTYKRITIQCKPIDNPKHGEKVELTYEFEAFTDAVAEVEAIKQARKHGYSFDEVIHITTFTK